MAEDAGKMLKLLDSAELSSLYHSSIRQMQPIDLIRRLEDENVSTRGHMSELRARLLRVEARKLRPRVTVPWYPEDEVSQSDEKPAITDAFKRTIEQLGQEKAENIAPDELMRTMVQLGFWNPDGKPVEPSGGKTKYARMRNRQSPFFRDYYAMPLYSGMLNDVDRRFKELTLISRESRRRSLEDYTNKVKSLASELSKRVQMETKNFEVPQQNQDTTKLPVNHHTFVTGESASPSLQKQGVKPSTEPVPSTSYDKEVACQSRLEPRILSQTYTQSGRSFADEDRDDDPFEHVDCSDWVDDFIE